MHNAMLFVAPVLGMLFFLNCVVLAKKKMSRSEKIHFTELTIWRADLRFKFNPAI